MKVDDDYADQDVRRRCCPHFVGEHQAMLINGEGEFLFEPQHSIAAAVAVFSSAGDDLIVTAERKFRNEDVDDINIDDLIDLELQLPDQLCAHGRREIELEQ